MGIVQIKLKSGTRDMLKTIKTVNGWKSYDVTLRKLIEPAYQLAKEQIIGQSIKKQGEGEK